MDATAAGEQKAPPPSNSASRTSSPEVRHEQLPLAGAGGGSGEAVEMSGVEDEQVERFYALLANIRALRGMYKADGGAAAVDGGGSSRKRARGGADPPWRPAFRMEDFEAGCERKVRRDGVRRQKTAHGEEEEEGKGEVVEEKDRAGLRVAARARTEC